MDSKKQTKQKCLGCKRIIPPHPKGKKKKYCTWVCYAYQAAPSWGMSREGVKGLALMAEARREAATAALKR